MATESHVFDSHITAWKEWQLAPWGRLRYSIAHANLRRHIQGRALRILDVGGGNGVESLPFAGEGHHVTIADYSAEMLAEAQRSAEESGIVERVTLLHTDISALPTLFPEPAFDLVLCHSILQYATSAGTTILSIGALLQPYGLLSIICPNPAS